jgi:ribosomal protein L13E
VHNTVLCPAKKKKKKAGQGFGKVEEVSAAGESNPSDVTIEISVQEGFY